MQNRFEKFDTTSYQEIILSLGVFRRETASGFYPWCNVECPRERVAEGLCGWRHGNSFPMTQSAQSHRQMRSIPHCSKAVFYVFVFDSIHNSATLHNLSPQIFHWSVFRAKGNQKILQRGGAGGFFEPRTGLEPVTFSLRMKCSTNWAIAAVAMLRGRIAYVGGGASGARLKQYVSVLWKPRNSLSLCLYHKC